MKKTFLIAIFAFVISFIGAITMVRAQTDTPTPTNNIEMTPTPTTIIPTEAPSTGFGGM